MTFGPPPALTADRPAALWRVLAAVLLLGLGACGLRPGSGPAGAGSPVAQAPAAATAADPLVAFAAAAQPGTEGRIVLSDGQPATARLLRSYHAASGRQCREVLVRTANAGRTQLVCETEGGGWAAARPLLRGGGAPNP